MTLAKQLKTALARVRRLLSARIAVVNDLPRLWKRRD